MEGQPFFTTVASLAISLAGFGAVIAWLRENPTGWDPVNLWRLKTIVRHALTISFLCLSLVPIHTLTQDDTITIRLGSAFAAAFALSDIWRFRHPDPDVWSPHSSWTLFVSLSAVLGLVGAANVIWANLGILQALILTILTSPAGIFSNFVREVGRRAAGASQPGD